MATKRILVRDERGEPVTDAKNGPLPADDAAVRLANSRARLQELLQDPAFAAEARQAMEGEEPADQVVERARAGEFAEQAFVEGYGAEFVLEAEVLSQ